MIAPLLMNSAITRPLRLPSSIFNVSEMTIDINAPTKLPINSIPVNRTKNFSIWSLCLIGSYCFAAYTPYNVLAAAYHRDKTGVSDTDIV